MESGSLIGFHWFKFRDATPATPGGLANNGIVDMEGNQYTETLEFMKEMNSQIYDFVDYTDTRPQGSIEVQAEADAFFHYNILGHSMGGMLGWAFAAAYPSRVNRLICASAVPSIIPARIALFKSLRLMRKDTDEADWFELLYQFLFSPAFFEERSTVEMAVANSMNYPYKQGFDAFSYQVDALQSFLSPVDISAVQCPTTFVTGGNDLLMTPALLKQYCLEHSHSDFHVVPDAAHAIHWEQPDAFIAIVEKALG